MLIVFFRSAKASIRLNCRKEHTCVGCGAVYSYPFVRNVTGHAYWSSRAKKLARRNADAALREEVEPHPCPNCGLYQPDMIGQMKANRHALIKWFGIVFMLVATIGYIMAPNIATYVIATIALLVLVGHFLVDIGNPNRNKAGNAKVSAAAVAGGKLDYTPGRTIPPSAEWAGAPKSIVHLLALMLVLIGTIMIAWPEVVRSTHHWPMNLECSPEIVGPGDRVQILMENQVSSMKGYRRGDPKVTLKLPGAGPGTQVAASTNQDDWGSSMRLKDIEKNYSTTPWVDLTVPADFAGRSAAFHIDLDVDYPWYAGDSTFETKHTSMSRDVTIDLASAGAGSRYKSLWWKMTLAGIGLIFVGGMLLIRAPLLRRWHALPVSLLEPVAAPPTTPRPMQIYGPPMPQAARPVPPPLQAVPPPRLPGAAPPVPQSAPPPLPPRR